MCSSVIAAHVNAASNWLHGMYTPRFIISHQFGVNAIWDYTDVAANQYTFGPTPAFGTPPVPVPMATWNGINTAPGTQQAVGFGVTYSSVPEYGRATAGLPIDVNFTHLETLTGAPGMPKYWMDRIQIRLYYHRR